MKNNIQIDFNQIYNEDCLVTMSRMPDNFVDLVLTSPPYDNLRKYNGFSFNFEKISAELYRITKSGGVVVWVVGDQTVNGSESGTSFRQALYFMDIGFKLYDTMIYASSKPPLTHKRYEQEFEYMFVFSKGMPKTFNPIKVECVNFGKKSGGTIRKTGNELLLKNKVGNVNQYRTKGNIWRYNTGYSSTNDKIAFNHPAIFPEKLAEDHILTWSNSGDLVYDPFLGSGTVSKMCILNKRHYLGSEISREYCKLAYERLKEYEK